jgi:hypothetical protein
MCAFLWKKWSLTDDFDRSWPAICTYLLLPWPAVCTNPLLPWPAMCTYLLLSWPAMCTYLLLPWPALYAYFCHIRDCTTLNSITFFNQAKIINVFNFLFTQHYWILIPVCCFVETVHRNKRLSTHPLPAMYMYCCTMQLTDVYVLTLGRFRN